MIRRARPEESQRLERIAVESKGYWRYDDDVMARFAEVLTIEPGYVRQHEVWVLENEGKIAGFYALIHHGQVSELDHLWLLPAEIGKGFGRLLFEHALERAVRHGARRLEWEAEPNAEGFYRRMRAAPARETTSSLGRKLQIFGRELDLTG